jgi:hypothetical protein
MGQTVIIRDHVAVGDVLVVTTDRSFTGQDGQSMTPDVPGTAVPGLLAESLFDLDVGIDHVYVLQNTVTLRRSGSWDDATRGKSTDVISAFLRHYDDSEEE